MKKYYIIRGDFGNCYALYWTENSAEENELASLGATNITRKEAIEYARAERQRRRDDPAFAYHADSFIYPVAYRDENYIPHYFETDSTGYIVLKGSK